ncbi:uncharacterized protein ARMOST_16509 [Armillaria ostoyae]|uniref:HAT C-terminal dimerisation domain-containing protein n=2 Tax=Armillaria ostoyae TaxID=47428 RepID=A0A284RWF3_ARMOS|nr:uncharacterized protein ARMOST_07020 [Armillaria ostoyae]SJL13072.1 uncharacterized protein ARMOST_16509 [Armillaria ostoyae]
MASQSKLITSDITPVPGRRQRVQSQRSKDSDAHLQEMPDSPPPQGRKNSKNRKRPSGATAEKSKVTPAAETTSTPAANPPAKRRRTTVVTEEEDDARTIAEGVDTIITKDKDGNISRLQRIGGPTITIRTHTPTVQNPSTQGNVMPRVGSPGLPSASHDTQVAAENIDDELPPLQDPDDSDDEMDVEGEELEEFSDEAELLKMMTKWTSPMYAFYSPIPEIEYRDGRKCHIFRCTAQANVTRCGHRIVRYLDTKDAQSTSNLRKHARKCWGEDVIKEADEAGTLDAARTLLRKDAGSDKRNGSITSHFARQGKGRVTYSHRQHTKQESRAEHVRWIAESSRPFAIVKDRGYNCLMKTGRPSCYVPSPSTVARDVKTVFGNTRQRISEMLQEHEGDLHFATDAWTSPNHRPYVAVTVHFEDKGKPVSLLLDIVEVAKNHTGENLAEAFVEILEDFKLSDKILSITCDNASNNDTMIEAIAEAIDDFPGEANRTRCFAHITNLVAKSLLKQFDELADGLDVEEVETRLRETEENGPGEKDNEDGLIDELAAMTVSEREEWEEQVLPAKSVLAKLRKLSFKIINSSTILLPAWNAILDELKFKPKKLPRDVATRWNSTYDMLEVAVEYKRAIKQITSDDEEAGDRAVPEYRLSSKEWKIAEQLRDVLKILKDATLFFSRSTPSLATVIPAMDHIDSVLTTQSLNAAYDPAIRASLCIAKKTLNRYYNITDYSEVYRISMVLHPRHKLAYFRKVGWSPTWIDTAHEIVQTEYERKYKNMAIEGEEENEVEEVTTSVSNNIFDSLPMLATAGSTQDELDRYLSTDPENVDDGLAWWNERRAMYPHLSRMALNYLSIPATSVDVERVFSRGRILLSHIRNRLSAQSTRALLCLGQWSLHGYVHDDDILAAAALPEVPDGEGEDGDFLMPDGWDLIESDKD